MLKKAKVTGGRKGRGSGGEVVEVVGKADPPAWGSRRPWDASCAGRDAAAKAALGLQTRPYLPGGEHRWSRSPGATAPPPSFKKNRSFVSALIEVTPYRKTTTTVGSGTSLGSLHCTVGIKNKTKNPTAKNMCTSLFKRRNLRL